MIRLWNLPSRVLALNTQNSWSTHIDYTKASGWAFLFSNCVIVFYNGNLLHLLIKWNFQLMNRTTAATTPPSQNTKEDIVSFSWSSFVCSEMFSALIFIYFVLVVMLQLATSISNHSAPQLLNMILFHRILSHRKLFIPNRQQQQQHTSETWRRWDLKRENKNPLDRSETKTQQGCSCGREKRTFWAYMSGRKGKEEGQELIKSCCYPSSVQHVFSCKACFFFFFFFFFFFVFCPAAVSFSSAAKRSFLPPAAKAPAVERITRKPHHQRSFGFIRTTTATATWVNRTPQKLWTLRQKKEIVSQVFPLQASIRFSYTWLFNSSSNFFFSTAAWDFQKEQTRMKNIQHGCFDEKERRTDPWDKPVWDHKTPATWRS